MVERAQCLGRPTLRTFGAPASEPGHEATGERHRADDPEPNILLHRGLCSYGIRHERGASLKNFDFRARGYQADSRVAFNRQRSLFDLDLSLDVNVPGDIRVGHAGAEHRPGESDVGGVGDAAVERGAEGVVAQGAIEERIGWVEGDLDVRLPDEDPGLDLGTLKSILEAVTGVANGGFGVLRAPLRAHIRRHTG